MAERLAEPRAAVPNDKRLGQLESDLQILKVGLEALEREQRNLDARLVRLESSLVFRVLRAAGNSAGACWRKTGSLLLHHTLHPLYLRLTGVPGVTRRYRRWLADRQIQASKRKTGEPPMHEWRYQPYISILMPVRDPNPEWLDLAVRSAQAQSYPHWQLCAANDGREASVAEYFRRKSAEDARISYAASLEPRGISSALNRANELATGEYVTFLDQDDLLDGTALYRVVEALQASASGADVLYSDEDYIDEAGAPLRPLFKPGWSPELLAGCMYFGHLLVVRKELLDRVGGFRSEFDGAQDYDVALRITERSEAVRHLPFVLYHWRRHTYSTALCVEAKPSAHGAGKRALEDAVQRRRWRAVVEDGSGPSHYRVRFEPQDDKRVSLIICSRNPRLLHKCLESIRGMTSYRPQEVVVVHHQATGGSGDQVIPSLALRFGCQCISYTDPFNFADMNNRGAAAASGDYLVFLNDDVRAKSDDWIPRLTTRLERPGVGVVGARLVYPIGTIQHAGIAVGLMDGVGHPGRNLIQSDFWPWLNLTRNVSAVTGACLAVRRDLFDSLGRFDAELAENFSDVDFCLRALQAGYEVILEADVTLCHAEAQSRVPSTRYDERKRFFQRWGCVLSQPDPFYSPNLCQDREDASLVAT